MMPISKIIKVKEKLEKLEKLYPVEAAYSSRKSLFNRAWNDNVITLEDYNDAKEYYGNLFNYVGD